MKEKIMGLVVAYNIQPNDLKNNIITYLDYIDKLIVIDNSDISNNLEDLENYSSKIKYISLNGNFGIAKALNIGCRYAIENRYDFVLTMDQDSRFQNNLLNEYSKYVKDDIIIYSPNYIIERKRRKEYKNETIELFWTMTSGNLLNLELFNKVGEFKEEYFIDGVDYEYCLRARKKGYKVLQVNHATLIHNPGITKTKRCLFMEYKYGYMNPIRLYYQVRNFSDIAQNYNCNKARIIVMIRLLKIFLLFDNKKKYIQMFIRARKDFKNKKFGVYDG